MYTSRWSCRWAPTPGRSATIGMPMGARSAAGPTPDRSSSCGELMAPPARMTSPPVMCSTPPPLATSTPTAREPSNDTRLTKVRVRTVRFGRDHDRVEIGLGGGQPPTAMDVAVERREAFLAVAVDVLGQLIAGLLGGREEGGEEGARGRSALQHERSIVAAPRIVRRRGEGCLHPLEVRQAMGEVPCRHPRIGAPALVVERIATLEDLAVDARGATQHLAPGVVDAPVVHERLRLGLVAPVVEAAADGERQGGRHVDEHVPRPVGPTCLQDEHAIARIGRQPIGQGAARRSPADDDEVVVRGRHRRRC